MALIAAGTLLQALALRLFLQLSGAAFKGVIERPNLVRTAPISTTLQQLEIQHILQKMMRGVTMVPAQGAYTGKEHTVCNALSADEK